MRAQLSDTGLVPECRRLPEISKGSHLENARGLRTPQCRKRAVTESCGEHGRAAVFLFPLLTGEA